LKLRAEQRETFVWAGISFVDTPSSILTLTYPLRRSGTAGAIDPSSKRWNDCFQLSSGVLNENVEKDVLLKTHFLAVGNLIGANSFEPHCKAELAAKTRSHLSKIKPPTEEVDEFSTFWESAIAETIDEIDNAIDFDSADMTCSSATARATDLEDGIVKFERVRATGRGRRAKESIIDTIKGIWYSGSGRYLPI
jgi:hypothetical protein